MKFSTGVVLVISLFQLVTMGIPQFLAMWACWALLFGAWCGARVLLFSFAAKAATENGSVSNLQKQDERRYMPKELLEQAK